MALSKYYYGLSRYQVAEIPFLWHGEERRHRGAEHVGGDISAFRQLLHGRIDSGEVKVDASGNSSASWKVAWRHDDSYVAREELIKLAEDLGERPDFLFGKPGDAQETLETAASSALPLSAFTKTEPPVVTAEQWADMTMSQKTEAMFAGVKVPFVPPSVPTPKPERPVAPKPAPGLSNTAIERFRAAARLGFDIWKHSGVSNAAAAIAAEQKDSSLIESIRRDLTRVKKFYPEKNRAIAQLLT